METSTPCPASFRSLPFASSMLCALSWRPACLVLLTALVFLAAKPALEAQTGTLTILYTFSGSNDGASPHFALVQGSDGSFYDTTAYGGANEGGTVFRITAAGVLTTLYSFSGRDGDGYMPGAALVQGSDGNFYGTTSEGGSTSSFADGTVFRITSAGALSILHSFSGGDGAGPNALVQGSDGSFYGTTGGGGANNKGTVFRITTTGALTTLYSFSGSDGAGPTAALTPDGAGNFYGTTYNGNPAFGGTVFRITPAGVLTTLYKFSSSSGSSPSSALIRGGNGSFYGTTNEGGANNAGTVFQITSTGTFTTLYSFSGGNGNNSNTLVQGNDGNFYGTTETGGADTFGTVFKLSVTAAFFTGETALSNGVYYLAFANGNYFGYYSFLPDPNYIFHFDLGFEYVFDANDGKGGVYFYDFASGTFFYTSPTFPFPYLYDFTLNSVLYYYPDPNNPGRYNTNGVRYFYDFNTGTIITK